MAFELKQQLQEALNRSRQILLVCPNQNNGDGLTAGLALATVLKKLGKQVDIVADGFTVPAGWKFLPGINTIKNELDPLQKFILKVDVSKNQLASLSYEVKDGQLYIYLTPKSGIINRDDLQTASTNLKYDLVITLDTADLEALGSVYDNNTELFVRTPIINIDHHSANEHFGQINLVDLSASSTAEIVWDFLYERHREHLTPEIATLLLAGIILKTKNFREGVTARTLSNASRLVEVGATRETIVHHLYRQRSLATLKLWGETLVNLKHDSSHGLVWVGIKRDDFRRAGATESDLPEIVDEILTNAPEAKIILLLYETNDNKIAGFLSTSPQLDGKELAKPFNPIGAAGRYRLFFTHGDLARAEQEAVENIKTRLP